MDLDFRPDISEMSHQHIPVKKLAKEKACQFDSILNLETFETRLTNFHLQIEMFYKLLYRIHVLQ